MNWTDGGHTSGMRLARTPEARTAGLVAFATGFFLWIVDLGPDGPWDAVALALMGLGALVGIATLSSAGSSAVVGWMRAHPVLVALAVGFILFSLAAALVAPSE
jgi:hypothetical protein